MITEIQSKKVLTWHEDSFPTHWDVNPYRGCSIGCKYCYAQYTHTYLGLTDFFKDIQVKTNVAECLAKELKSKNWKNEQIKIGGISDLYQHSERKFELLPKIFDVIKKHKNPVFIQTKSTLILRDFDIIKELSNITTVDISTSITSFDEQIRKIIEPFASPTIERVEMLEKFKGIARKTVLGLMPIIPLLTDSEENIDMAFRIAKEKEIDHIVTSPLFLRGGVKPKFFNLMKRHFPEKSAPFKKLYHHSDIDKSYYLQIKSITEKLKNKYNMNSNYIPAKASGFDEQLKLF